MGCIPPIPDFNTGLPTCPVGYTYDSVQKLCCPDSTAPVDLTDPTIKKLVVGLADAEFDPAQAERLGMRGVEASGIIERVVTAFFMGAVKLLRPLLELAASLLDDALAVLAEVFTAAQGQHTHGFYLLAAELMEDLLGIAVDGEKMYGDFLRGGRQAAMTDLGGALFSTITSELAGVTQTTTAGDFNFPPGKGIAGLPDVQLSPEQGIAGAKAFMGYVAAFAIREGNTDFLAHYLPLGIGNFFKDFAEDFAKSLGLGRMLRIAWKPAISTMVAAPMQAGLNKQYRPTSFTAEEAIRDRIMHPQNEAAYRETMARHGYADDKQDTLYLQKIKKPTYEELRVLSIMGGIDPDIRKSYLHAEGWTDEAIGFLDTAADLLPARNAALHAAASYASQYFHGKITKQQFDAAVDAAKVTNVGQKLLSDGEVTSLHALPSIATGAPRRHLSYVQLNRLFIDGLITLQEFEADLVTLGYDPDAVIELTQELLLSEKRAASRAAKAAAAAIHGPLHKLTVAQMEKAFTTGLLGEPEIRTELQARQYSADAINALMAEFHAKLPG